MPSRTASACCARYLSWNTRPCACRLWCRSRARIERGLRLVDASVDMSLIARNLRTLSRKCLRAARRLREIAPPSRTTSRESAARMTSDSVGSADELEQQITGTAVDARGAWNRKPLGYTGPTYTTSRTLTVRVIRSSSLGAKAGSRKRRTLEVDSIGLIREACVTRSVTIRSERDAQDTTRRTWVRRLDLAQRAEFRKKIADFEDPAARLSRPPPSTTRPSLRIKIWPEFARHFRSRPVSPVV